MKRHAGTFVGRTIIALMMLLIVAQGTPLAYQQVGAEEDPKKEVPKPRPDSDASFDDDVSKWLEDNGYRRGAAVVSAKKAKDAKEKANEANEEAQKN
ncbi:hypothetical protein BH23CHL2_BH23CHL2_24780 [soil metagenome]